MCGIVGVLHSKEKEKVIKDMADEMAHRGPDDEGFYHGEDFSLGMRRLSIIAISTSKQPITSEDENYSIVFNGEIYNYKELREDLQKKGYQFKTDGDTEVILHQYREYKEKGLDKLRGMFVFAIYDKPQSRIFIARDYFGIKPLYYAVKDKKVQGFASEIKSLLKIPDYRSEINDGAVFNYLSYQYNPLKETFWKNIYTLDSGSFLEIDAKTGEFREGKFWNYSFEKNENMDESQAKEELKEVMNTSVKYHMVSDVEVGSFLSGGIDSSLIATLLSRNSLQKINTFTVGFDHVSEENEAQLTSDAIGSNHLLKKVHKEEYMSVLPKVFWHFDEPVADPSAVGLYFLASEAAKKVKVVLSGEGADELFGGYNIYRESLARNNLRFIPKFVFKFLRVISDSLPLEFKGKNFLRRLSTPLEDRYIGNAKVFTPSEVNTLWKGKRQEQISLRDIYKKVEKETDASKMQYIDIHTWLVGDILAKADKMTMAHSLELRVPFLDLGVYEFSRTIPDRLKFKDGQTKYLLREAAQDIIPEETRNRRKLGFPIPIREWLKDAEDEVFSPIFNSSYIQKNLELDKIKLLIAEHKEGKRDNARKIYTLLALAIWLKVYFEK